MQYERSLDAHEYPLAAATVRGNRASLLLLTGDVSGANREYLQLLSRHPDRRDLYAPALRAFLGDSGLIEATQATTGADLDAGALAQTEARLLAEAALSRAAGDSSTALGLDCLRRYYFR